MTPYLHTKTAASAPADAALTVRLGKGAFAEKPRLSASQPPPSTGEKSRLLREPGVPALSLQAAALSSAHFARTIRFLNKLWAEWCPKLNLYGYVLRFKKKMRKTSTSSPEATRRRPLPLE
jgi:hypothetical protein